MALVVPAGAGAEIYNPTTMESIPTSYYYPPPSPSFEPPPMYFPPLPSDFSEGGGDSAEDGGSQSGTQATREEKVLGYHRSSKVGREANRQMAALFVKRLGKGNFDRGRFIKEADKGTFRAAFRKLIATERLNLITVVQLVQFAAGDPAARTAQVEATRRAGIKTFKGDLGTVQLGTSGFEPRA